MLMKIKKVDSRERRTSIFIIRISDRIKFMINNG
jgi:hypothetical protein